MNMKYIGLKNHIRVFYDANLDRRPWTDIARWWIEQEKQDAKRWWQELLTKVFTVTSTRKSTEDILKDEIQKLNAQSKNISKWSPYGTIIEEYKLFMKDIFDEKWNYKQSAGDSIKALSRAIWIDGMTNKEDLEKVKKRVSEFIKEYPLDTFVDKVHYATVKHPFISKTWIVFNEYGNIKKKVKELGTFLPPEYRSVIQTAENIMWSKEFQKNTGNIETTIREKFGQGKSVEEFQKNMKTILDMSKSQKKSFTMNDFEKQFNEEIKLTESEKSFVTKYIEDVKKDISQERYDTQAAKIARLNSYIESNKNNPNNLSKAVNKSIINSLQIIQSQVRQWRDGSWFSNIKDTLSGRGNEREEANAEAAKKTIDTGKKHFVWVSDGKFRVISILELKNAMESDVWKEVNFWAFSWLIAIPDWQEILVKEFWKTAIAWVWGYLEKNPNTRLFQWQNAKAKTFFISEYQREVQEQSDLIKQKKIWELTDDVTKTFPQTLKLLPELKTNPRVAEVLKRWDMTEFYNIITTGRSNGEIKNVMSVLKQEINAVKVESEKKALETSKSLKDKTVWDYIWTLFVAKNKTDEIFLEKMKSRKFAQGTMSVEDAIKLEVLMTGKDNAASIFLANITRANNAWKAAGQAKQIEVTISKKPPNQQAQQLTKEEEVTIRSAGNVARAIQQLNMGDALAKQNLNSSDTEWVRQRNQQALEDRKYVAITVATYIQSPWVTKDDARELIKEVYNTKVDNAKLDQWIDTQVFLSKYVEEKNFVDIVEKNAAYMSLRQTKTVWEVYGAQVNNVSIASMSSDVGSIRLSNIAMEWWIQLPRISELMNCKMEIWDAWVFSRTIRSPDWKVVAENIPLENITSTITQLGRFYMIGIWALAPYMQEISKWISNVRSDKVTWLDGDYAVNEDKKFLKIMGTMLYGESSIPSDPNIPNLMRLFSKVWRENDPSYILRQKWFINDSGSINTFRLAEWLEAASKKVS